MKAALGWSLVGLAIAGSIVIGPMLGPAGLIAYAMGPVVVWTLVIVAVASPLKRGRDAGYKANVTLLMGVIVVLVFAWYLRTAIEVSREDREVVRARPETQRITQAALQEISAITAGAVDGPTTPAWAPYANPVQPVALDDDALPLSVRLAELARRARARDVEFARESARAAAESGLDIVADPVRLVDAGERTAARAQMQAYREYLQSLESKIASAREQHRTELAALGLSKVSAAAASDGYERSVADAWPALQEQVRQGLSIVEQAEAIVGLVEDHAQAIRLEGVALVFSEAAVQSEYDGLLQQLGIAAP